MHSLVRPFRCLIAVVLSLSLSGCSWIFIDEAPPEHRWQEIPRQHYVDCHTGNLWPGLDTLLAVSNALNASFQAAGGTSAGQSGENVWLVPALVAGLFTWSALDGFERSKTCRRFQFARSMGASPNRPASPNFR